MASKKGRIVVAGGIYMDIVVQSKGLPGIGEYAYGDALHFIPGGNGLNQAVAASRLNGKAALIGFTGDDMVAAALRQFLKDEHVNIANVRTVKGSHSGSIVYLLINKAERHVVLTGSNMRATLKDLPRLKFSASDMVVSQLTIQPEIIERIFTEAKKAGAKTILNVFPNYKVKKRILQLTDYLFLNEVELAYRTGDKNYVMAQHKDLHMDMGEILARSKRLRARNDQVIIVTLAERGVVGITGNKPTYVKGIKIKFADATGAGDCFLGAFATGMLEGMGFRSALEFANNAAAMSVMKVGTTSSFPVRSEVDLFFAKHSSGG